MFKGRSYVQGLSTEELNALRAAADRGPGRRGSPAPPRSAGANYTESAPVSPRKRLRRCSSERNVRRPNKGRAGCGNSHDASANHDGLVEYLRRRLREVVRDLLLSARHNEQLESESTRLRSELQSRFAVRANAAQRSGRGQADEVWRLRQQCKKYELKNRGLDGQLKSLRDKSDSAKSEMEATLGSMRLMLEEKGSEVLEAQETERDLAEKLKACQTQLVEQRRKETALAERQGKLQDMVAQMLKRNNVETSRTGREEEFWDELATDQLLRSSAPPDTFPVPTVQRAFHKSEYDRQNVQLKRQEEELKRLRGDRDRLSADLNKVIATRPHKIRVMKKIIRKQNVRLSGAVRRIHWLLYEKQNMLAELTKTKRYRDAVETKLLEQQAELEELRAAGTAKQSDLPLPRRSKTGSTHRPSRNASRGPEPKLLGLDVPIAARELSIEELRPPAPTPQERCSPSPVAISEREHGPERKRSKSTQLSTDILPSIIRSARHATTTPTSPSNYYANIMSDFPSDDEGSGGTIATNSEIARILADEFSGGGPAAEAPDAFLSSPLVSEG